MGSGDFNLQFDSALIPALALRYGSVSNDEEDAAFKSGADILRGNYTLENLRVIVHWKSPRKIGLLDLNTKEDLARAFRFVIDLRTTEKSAIETLIKLHGVGIPVASAILTAIYPDKYTIIDFRALESLGVGKWPTDSVEYYLKYLKICRTLANTHGVSLRSLDRALWQWSKDRGSPQAKRDLL